MRLVLCRCSFAAGYSDKWLCAPTEQLCKGKHNTSVFKCTCIRFFACTYISVILNIRNGYVKGESKISLLQGIRTEKKLFWNRTEGSLVRNVKSPKLIWRLFRIHFESSSEFHIILTALWSLKLQFVSEFLEDKPPPRAWNNIYICDTYLFFLRNIY